MAPRLSAKRLPRYSLEFKQKVAKVTEIPGLEVQRAAEALDLVLAGGITSSGS